MRTPTLIALLAIALCACDNPVRPPKQLTQPPAAPTTPTPPAAQEPAAREPAPQEPAAPAEGLPPGLHIVDIPGEASQVRWELHDETYKPAPLDESIRAALADSLFPALGGPAGDLLIYDVADAVVVYDLKKKQQTRPIPLTPGGEVLGYGASTSADRIFAITRADQGDIMLHVAPRAADQQPVSMKITPHLVCGSLCVAPSVHFADEETIRYHAATDEGEVGAQIEVKLP